MVKAPRTASKASFDVPRMSYRLADVFASRRAIKLSLLVTVVWMSLTLLVHAQSPADGHGGGSHGLLEAGVELCVAGAALFAAALGGGIRGRSHYGLQRSFAPIIRLRSPGVHAWPKSLKAPRLALLQIIRV